MAWRCPGIRFKAGLALSQIGEESIDALIVAFDRGDASVKDIAALSTRQHRVGTKHGTC